MNIVVFGGTGPTGQQVLKQALSQGHTVTAFVRNPAKLPTNDTRLRVVIGDTTLDMPKVAEAVSGQDLIISTLGRRSSFKSDHLIERSMQAIVPAMERAGVRRLILVSAFGVGESRRDAPLIPRMMYRVGERLELHGFPKISRADVAHFILAEVGKRAFVRKVAVISY